MNFQFKLEAELIKQSLAALLVIVELEDAATDDKLAEKARRVILLILPEKYAISRVCPSRKFIPPLLSRN